MFSIGRIIYAPLGYDTPLHITEILFDDFREPTFSRSLSEMPRCTQCATIHFRMMTL